MVTLDQINFTVVGIVALVGILVIVGIGYGGYLLLMGGGEDVNTPSAENYSLEYTDSEQIIVTQNRGKLQTEHLELMISYDDATPESRNVTLDSVGTSKTITPSETSASVTNIQLNWNGEETVTLGEVTVDTSNGTGSPPQNQLSIDNMSIELGETVQLDASDRIPNAEEYIWNLGNGIVYSDANITHTYSNTGEYNSSLTITTTNGEKISDGFVITVTEESESNNTDENETEVIDEITVPDEGNVSEPVTFDVAVNYNNSSELNYIWSTDGTEYNEKTVTHTYNESGSYNVSVNVKFGDIVFDSQSKTINVVEQNQNNSNNTDENDTQTGETSADINISNQNNLTVEFSAAETVSNGSISTYEWSPEPGVSDETSNPQYNHTYSSEGNYTAQLTIVTDSGQTDTDSITFNVSNSTNTTENNTTENNTNETDVSGDPDIIIEMDNRGDQYWTVQSVSGTDVNNVLPSDEIGDNNPDIHLEIGQRYRFTGIPTEPWEEDINLTFGNIVKDPLLSQTQQGTYNSDSNVGWVDNNQSVDFTATSEFSENVSSYYAPQNENQMMGEIIAD